MRKKVLALFVLLALLIGLFAVGASANSTTTPERYQVGYAIRDINPWVDPADHSKGVLPVQLVGNGNEYARECEGLMNDNDDDVVGEGDGLFATATAITDPYGKTVIFITLDALQAYYDWFAKEITTKIVAELGKYGVLREHIMFSASHTHSGPAFDNLRSSGYAEYHAYALQQITDAALEAFNDRAEAVMTKGFIDAKDSTAFLGYNNGEGYHMNAVRHYDVTIQHKYLSSYEKQYVEGSNFGHRTEDMSGYKEISKVNVFESDNTMYVLQFEFPNDSQKEPVLFVNWRAHSTTNSGGTYAKCVSSDYINSIRANLKKENYRAAFFQGASGNIVIKSAVQDDWTAESNRKLDTNVYGRILANVVLDCVDRAMTDELAAGSIRVLQQTYHGTLQQDSEGLRAAAQAYIDGSEALGENQFLATPYRYKYNNKTYIINSKFHARSIINRINPIDSYTDLRLNVITMGDNVAFLTAPNELADRYDRAGSTKNEDNDWLELNNTIYGTPFVLGYTNGRDGYIPFSLEYTYNTDEYYNITGKGAAGDEFHGAGSYEANTSKFARYTGEEIIQTFKTMINTVDDVYYYAECPACKKQVEWQPLTKDTLSTEYDITTGHYYLYEDVPLPSGSIANRGLITDGSVVCLDLNGKTLCTRGKAFRFDNKGKNGGTLNITDSSDSKGCIESCTAQWSEVGGIIQTDSQNGNETINLYGGTLKFSGENLYTTKGGIIAIYPNNTFNMYGGVIDASKCTLVQDTSNQNGGANTATDGCGAAIAVFPNATLNISGGRVIAGKAEPEAGRADCILVQDKTSKVTLSGDAQIDEIYFDALCPENFKISGAYTGTATLQFNQSNITLQDRMDIGNNENAGLTEATLTCGNDNNYYIIVSGADLLLSNTAAAVCGSDGTLQYYSSLEKAITEYSASAKYIKLFRDIPDDVSIDKDIYLDLNGYDITGKLSVDEGYVLYCMDSQTDDYTVEDDFGYGKLTNVSGTIKGIPEESAVADDGYLKVTENGAVSFHRVNLDLTHMTLRPVQSNGEPSPGVYYKSNFMGDEKVASAITQYGVALSVQEMPDEKNLETMCKYSTYAISDGYEFKAGKGGNSANGTLLKGIMKSDNPYLINLRNSNMPIFGRAYIQTDFGYMFGGGRDLTLKTLTEKVDAKWNDIPDQHDALISMYKANIYIMQNWNLPNLKNNAN